MVSVLDEMTGALSCCDFCSPLYAGLNYIHGVLWFHHLDHIYGHCVKRKGRVFISVSYTHLTLPTKRIV